MWICGYVDMDGYEMWICGYVCEHVCGYGYVDMYVDMWICGFMDVCADMWIWNMGM